MSRNRECYAVTHLQLAARDAIAGRGRSVSRGDAWGGFLSEQTTQQELGTSTFGGFFFFLLQGSSIVSEGTSSRDPLFASLGLAACDQRLEAPKALGLRNMSGNDPTHVHFQTSVVSIWGAVSVFLTKRRLFEHFFTPVSTTISHLLFRTCTYSYCCCVLLCLPRPLDQQQQ